MLKHPDEITRRVIKLINDNQVLDTKRDSCEYQVFDLPGNKTLLKCLAVFVSNNDSDPRVLIHTIPDVLLANIVDMPSASKPRVLSRFAVSVHDITSFSEADHSEYSMVWLRDDTESITIKVPFEHLLDIKLNGKLGIVK